jgi:spore germination protein
MTNAINNRQIFFIITLVVTTYTIISIPRTMAVSAGTGSWITLLIAALIFAVAATTIIRLNNMFPGKTLVDYTKLILGKAMAGVLGVFFLLYFLTVGVFLSTQMTNLLQAEFYPETPQWAMLLIGIPVYGAIAYKGVTNVARLIEIYGSVYLVVIIVVHIIMLTQGMTYSILPLFNKAEAGRYITAVKDVVIAFLGVELFTMMPFTRQNGKKAVKTAFWAMIVVGFIYIMVVLSCIGIVGFENVQSYQYPLIEAIKIVDAPFVERFDIAYLTVGFLGLIGGVSVVYLGMVEYACRLMPRVKRWMVVVAAGAVQMVLSLFALGVKDPERLADTVIAPAGLIAGIAIPTILFVTARMKRRASKKA